MGSEVEGLPRPWTRSEQTVNAYCSVCSAHPCTDPKAPGASPSTSGTCSRLRVEVPLAHGFHSPTHLLRCPGRTPAGGRPWTVTAVCGTTSARSGWRRYAHSVDEQGALARTWCLANGEDNVRRCQHRPRAEGPGPVRMKGRCCDMAFNRR